MNNPHETTAFPSMELAGKASPEPTQLRQSGAPSHVLPANVGDAVKHLSDQDLDRLFEAAFDEAKRRGRLPWRIGEDNSGAEMFGKAARHKVETGCSLTTGQINAIRASFKAGVKPTKIARQFRISMSSVRNALSS